jgi:hypothetical protein
VGGLGTGGGTGITKEEAMFPEIMSRSVAEVIILAINALGAGILMFIARVVQTIMNEMDELEFKRFLNRLDRAAMGEPFAVTVATLPFIAAVLYFLAFGFVHWWFTAGFVVWTAGSIVTKVTNIPIYQWAADPKNTDPPDLRQQRRKLQLGNNVRAWTTLVSVVLMACQFGVVEVLLTIVASVIVAVPLLLLARRYTPGAAGPVSAAAR